MFQSLSTICSEQISEVENLIDPINLDVLDEYIVKNVKRSAVATKVNTNKKFNQLKYIPKITSFSVYFWHYASKPITIGMYR